MSRKACLVALVMFFLSSCSDKEKVKIEKVEHFYISSPNAKDLFRLFNEQFALPAVWDFQVWGSFSSGGITLGNVVVEFVESPSEQTSTYYGIALQPNQSLKGVVRMLDSLKISHGSISKASEWNTLSLNNLLPDYINLFLCDYTNREQIARSRKKAMDKLALTQGGTLGIRFLKEIVMGTEAPDKFIYELEKMPGVIRKENDFLLAEGPVLKLVASGTPFLGLIINVKSIDKATLALEALGIKTSSTEHGLELLDQLGTTRITLYE